MSINIQQVSGGVCAPKNFLAAGIHCGLRKNKSKKDLALIYSEKSCVSAMVSTQNKVKSGSLLVTLENAHRHNSRAVICNTVYANVAVPNSEDNARDIQQKTAEILNINQDEVTVASTGIIGDWPCCASSTIAGGIPGLVSSLTKSGGSDAAHAILTTDTHPKEIAVEFEINGHKAVIGGIAKGSGMIHPNMATMLCFITTDAAVNADALQSALNEVCGRTFNMISVDRDTSTNDMVSVMANGSCGNPVITKESAEYGLFVQGLEAVMQYLSKEIARDGEGATKLLECTVTGAANEQAAKTAAKSVISSTLFKAAMFGRDANWGRIMCALGYSGTDFDPESVSIQFKSSAGNVIVCEKGAAVGFDENIALTVLGEDEIKIIISIGTGKHTATAWGCDLTYEYVKINGEYRS